MITWLEKLTEFIHRMSDTAQDMAYFKVTTNQKLQ